MSVEEKRMRIESNHPHLSIRRQCDLFRLNRTSFYDIWGQSPRLARFPIERSNFQQLIKSL